VAITDAIFKQLRKNAEKGGEDTGVNNKLRSKTAMIISVFAAIFSINMFFQNSTNSLILNNTIKANDLWSFYQAKSVKQGMAEYAWEDAVRLKDTKRADELKARIDRYESEPATGEGKKEIFARAKAIEAERDIAKKRAPWFGIAGSVMQIAIVLLTASMLTAGVMMFWAGIGAQVLALAIMAQAFFLFF
jgi:hypothetical protein